MPGNVEAVAEVLRLAQERGLTVVPRGAGTKIDWGWPPPHVDIMLDTGRLAGLRHRPEDDDTAEVDAGTPLRAMQAILAADKRRVSIDVRSADATVGGVVASDEAGPLRLSHPDPLVAVSYVDASGALTRADATAVADQLSEADRLRLRYESQRPHVVLVSATLRVQPIPAKQVWVSYPLRELSDLSPMVSMIISGAAPAAIEVDLPSNGATHAGWETLGTLTVLLEGEHPEVAEREAMLAKATGILAHSATTAPNWWLRYPFDPGDVALRVEVPIEYLLNAVLALHDAFAGPVSIRGSAGLGVLHAALPGGSEPKRVSRALESIRHVLHNRNGRCQVVAAPPAVRQTIDVWDMVQDLPLLRRVADRMDPDRRPGPDHLASGR